ncbi:MULTISPECIES: sugar porter family MFS transporter [Streptomyces]|uniref:sugar porter family MFS transporter n=1 Tax=Streptomyces lycopersici TaxID=2974589 RepID=UPI0021D33036|nr:sugar porter family MFS transporter [Streptomyces sp. NEAU-383]
MTVEKPVLDEAPVNSFHKRIVLVAMGGPFCDGYLLGIIAVALPQLTTRLGLDTIGSGLVAASALLGVFLGGLIFGPVTDRVGRRLMYVLNLVVFVVCSVLQFWIAETWQLVVLRLITGIAIGADYPIASALTAELVPRKLRGPALSGLVLAWWLGYGMSFWAGWAMRGIGPEAWRWMLVSAAVPAALFLVLRSGIPESPLWLASRGRLAEAQRILLMCFGQEATSEELNRERGNRHNERGIGLGNLVEIFRRGYGVPLLFCSVFWFCQVAPAYSIRTFQPQLLESLGVGDTYASSALIMAIAVVGIAVGMVLVNRMGRRPLLIASFVGAIAALVALGVVPHSVAFLIVVLFVLYNFSEAAGSGLQFVYPSELFPTDLRATGVGFATAMSRLGSMASTFVLPLTTDALGTAGTLLLGAGITAVGLLVTLLLAPETKTLSLGQSSTRPRPGHRAPEPEATPGGGS